MKYNMESMIKSGIIKEKVPVKKKSGLFYRRYFDALWFRGTPITTPFAW
ncbi:MAG: hypothetical protein ACLTQG_01660 [Hungatella sp.]